MEGRRLLAETGFAPADRDQWRALAEKALRGASFDEALTARTDDGIVIQPLYDRAEPQLSPRKNPASRWAVVQRIDDPDPARANAQAREDVANGATGLALVFEGAPNAFGYGLPSSPEALEQALDGVPLDKVYLRTDVHPMSRSVVDWFVGLVGSRRIDPTKLNLAFGIDPSALFAGTGRLRMSIEALQASMPPSLAHFFSMGVPGALLEADGRVYHNGGATEAQELGAMIATAVGHLRMFEAARQPLVYAAPHIGFALAVDQDQFLSTAKVRALRRLWKRVQEACSIPPSVATIHAETSWRMMTVKDPETNILRAAIATFAAATGGADSISVLPYTMAHGLPDDFARRVARNVQLVMADESHIDFVADPAAGAGGIEALTEALCEKAWAEFQAIEAEGGMLKSLSEGRFQTRVREARERRAAAYRAGEHAIVGTTLYPMKEERPVSTLPAERRPVPTDGAVFCEAIPALRIDETIEG